MSNEKDRLLDHIYDGIQEYDNPLPPWWVYLFIITIIWGVIYLFYYDVTGMGDGSIKQYKREVADFNKQMSSNGANLANISLGKDDYVMKKDDNIIEAGKQIFLKNCVACHGQKGEGGIGPNLTDDYWIHGGEFQNVITTIFNGVPEKGMTSWKAVLNKQEIYSVACFVYNLNGSNPQNPKAPQGNLFKRAEVQ